MSQSIDNNRLKSKNEPKIPRPKAWFSDTSKMLHTKRFINTSIHTYIHTYIHTHYSPVALINTSLTTSHLNACLQHVRGSLNACTSRACMHAHRRSTLRALRPVTHVSWQALNKQPTTRTITSNLLSDSLTARLLERMLA